MPAVTFTLTRDSQTLFNNRIQFFSGGQVAFAFEIGPNNQTITEDLVDGAVYTLVGQSNSPTTIALRQDSRQQVGVEDIVGGYLVGNNFISSDNDYNDIILRVNTGAFSVSNGSLLYTVSQENGYTGQFSITWQATITGPPTTVETGPTGCTDPVSWTSLLPTCASAPSTQTSPGGLRLTASGSSITLNLQNYADKLVTLRVIHQVNASWQQGFSFNASTSSDITVNGSALDGAPYSKSPFSNPALSGTNTIYLYNLDGGNYNYTFTSSSVSGGLPTRTNYNLVSTPTTATVQTTSGGDLVNTQVTTITNTCNPFTEIYPGAWPPCPVGVYILQNGGDEISWTYGDGYGSTSAQVITVKVVGVRNVVSGAGTLCVNAIKDGAWIKDPATTAAQGNCIGDYRFHSLLSSGRFRSPSSRTSKTSFPTPMCFDVFRGIAGAKTPTEWNFQ